MDKAHRRFSGVVRDGASQYLSALCALFVHIIKQGVLRIKIGENEKISDGGKRLHAFSGIEKEVFYGHQSL